MKTLLLVLLVTQAPGRPLFYWGARPATIVIHAAAGAGIAARVTEIHGIVDEGDLVLRVSFDRAVSDALYLPSGAPVSGRLRAALYVDGDVNRSTGWWPSRGILERVRTIGSTWGCSPSEPIPTRESMRRRS